MGANGNKKETRLQQSLSERGMKKREPEQSARDMFITFSPMQLQYSSMVLGHLG